MNPIPKLIKNDAGQICMQLCLGAHCATLPLPESLAGATEAEMQEFFNIVVPEITANLRRQRREHLNKVERKANR